MYRRLCWLERRSYRAADQVITVNSSLEENRLCPRRAAPGDGDRGGERAQPGPYPSGRPPRPELKHGKPFLCCWLGLMGPRTGSMSRCGRSTHLVHVIGRTDCHFAFVGDGEARAPVAAAGGRTRDLGLGELSRLGRPGRGIHLPVHRGSRTGTEHGGDRVPGQGHGVHGLRAALREFRPGRDPCARGRCRRVRAARRRPRLRRPDR